MQTHEDPAVWIDNKPANNFNFSNTHMYCPTEYKIDHCSFQMIQRLYFFWVVSRILSTGSYSCKQEGHVGHMTHAWIDLKAPWALQKITVTSLRGRS